MEQMPTFDELTDTLKKVNPDMHISQVHGILCGLLCVKEKKTGILWKSLFPKQKKNPALLDMLEKIYHISYQQLSDFSFEFNLVLPDDESDIHLRAESLGLWVQGFLKGLKKGGVSPKGQTEDETKEALNDLTEIAQINFDDIADHDDESEMAYTELVEYVRLSAVMIFQNLKNVPSTQDVNIRNGFLH